MMANRYLLLFLAAWLSLFSAQTSSAQSQTKRGGLSFRLDENPPADRIMSYDSLFTAHGLNYSFAVTSYVLPLVPQYVSILRNLSAKGVELMDNTPTHATQFFNVLYFPDTNLFSGKPGVDHINGQKVCLSYTSCDTTQSHGEGFVNVKGNKVISYNPGEFHDLLAPTMYFAISLSAPINKVCLFYDVRSSNLTDPDTLYIKSFWDENLSLPESWYLRYNKLLNYNVTMHDSAVYLLGKRSLDLFDSVNLPRPVSWIHPDGQYPAVNPWQIKPLIGEKLGFLQATSEMNNSLYCYNEVNPMNLKEYSIPGEEMSMEQAGFSYWSHIVANAVSKHYVLNDFGRLVNPQGGFGPYIKRMDSLLTWCQFNQIPVRTYSQWKSILYDSVPQKVFDIFPKLNVDADSDGWPDGFDHDTTQLQGTFDPSEGVAYSGYKSFKMSGTGTMFRVTNLAGLEKGNNAFKFWIKTSDTSHTVPKWVNMNVFFPETGLNYTFSSVAGPGTYNSYMQIIDVPDSVTQVTISASRDTSYNDTVHISGMEFRSSGFLSQSSYPLQTQTANTLFNPINLNSLIIDTVFCPPASCIWTFHGNRHLTLSVNSQGIMKISRPTSFWTGKDSLWAVAHSIYGYADSCFFRFNSLPIPAGCKGTSINISILDTITPADYIVWTSIPYDSTISDTTIFNPTVSPDTTTMYYVKVYNLLGNIFKDSIQIIRNPFPEPGLFSDTTVCQGDSLVLSAAGGGSYLWSTGDTTAAIRLKPEISAKYIVQVTNQYNCSASDSTMVHVEPVPVVTLSGLLPQYCTTDNCVLMVGTPSYGTFHGRGVLGSMFCPKQAKAGPDTIWFSITTAQGCYNADTAYLYVNPPPVIPKLPDSSYCGNKQVTLNAGPGADNYLWSNGDTNQITRVDTVSHGLGLQKVWVYVTKNGCVSRDTARIRFIACPIGVGESQFGMTASVYPNPFSEQLAVELTEDPADKDLVKIYDLKGEMIYSSPLKGRTTIIQTCEFNPGIYVLFLRHKEESFYLRIVRL